MLGTGRSTIAVLVLVLAAGLAGCEGSSCTDLTCSDRISYDIPDSAFAEWGAGPERPITIETCVDDVCATRELTFRTNGTPRQSPELDAAAGTWSLDEGHNISMTVIDSDGTSVFSRSYRDVILDKFEPNGASCPSCFVT